MSSTGRHKRPSRQTHPRAEPGEETGRVERSRKASARRASGAFRYRNADPVSSTSSFSARQSFFLQPKYHSLQTVRLKYWFPWSVRAKAGGVKYLTPPRNSEGMVIPGRSIRTADSSRPRRRVADQTSARFRSRSRRDRNGPWLRALCCRRRSCGIPKRLAGSQT